MLREIEIYLSHKYAYGRARALCVLYAAKMLMSTMHYVCV